MTLFSKSRRRGASVAGIFGAAFVSVLLLCGAGSVPVQNFLPQGSMQGDMNAGNHNITNAATVSAVNVVVSGSLTAPSSFTLPFSKITSTPTTLSGYGITDPVALTSGSYADPAWITSLSATKLTGTINAARMPALTGDVTSSAGTVATTIAANAVTNAKLATMAANAIKANATGSSAVPTDFVTGANVLTALAVATNNQNGFPTLGPSASFTVLPFGAYKDNALYIGNQSTTGAVGSNGFAAISFLDKYGSTNGYYAMGLNGNSTLPTTFNHSFYMAALGPYANGSSGTAQNEINEPNLTFGENSVPGVYNPQIEIVYQDPATVFTTMTTTAGSTAATVTGSTTGLSAISGGYVVGPGTNNTTPPTTFTISGTAVTLSQNALSSVTGQYFCFSPLTPAPPRVVNIRGNAGTGSGYVLGPLGLQVTAAGKVGIGASGSSADPVITSGAQLSTPSLAINGSLLSLAGNHTISGAFASTFTMTGATTVTFPTSGTLISTANLGTNVLTALGNATNSANGVLQLDANGLIPTIINPNQAAGAGTIALSGVTVTGTGTSFLTACPPGTTLVIGGVGYSVVSVASNTSLTVDNSGSVSAGTSYNIAPALFKAQLYNNPSNQTVISGYGYPISIGAGAAYSAAWYKNGNTWGIFVDNSTGLFSIRNASNASQVEPLQINENAPDAAINISSTGVSTKGVLKQTSVTSAMLKADASGNLVSAGENVDYAGPVTMTANTTGTITFNSNSHNETIYNTSGSTISSATITLPSTTAAGQVCRYVTGGAVTSVTVSGTVDIGAAVTTLAANSTVAWQADATSGHFVRIQ